MNFTTREYVVSCVTSVNIAGLELCLWERIGFHKVQAQLWQALPPPLISFSGSTDAVLA